MYAIILLIITISCSFVIITRYHSLIYIRYYSLILHSDAIQYHRLSICLHDIILDISHHDTVLLYSFIASLYSRLKCYFTLIYSSRHILIRYFYHDVSRRLFDTI